MIASAIPWLPKDALEPARFEKAISALVAEWNEAWLVKAKATSRIKLRMVAANGRDEERWRTSADCAIGLDDRARIALAEAMLERPVTPAAVSDHDRPLLIDITDRCLDDLIGRISWLVDRNRCPEIQPGELDSHHGMAWDLGLQKAGTTISLIISQSALIRWRKSLVPLSPTACLESLQKALQIQPVQLAVRLGKSCVTLADMRNLSIGDVVKLDRKTEDALPVFAADRQVPITGRLSRDGSRPEIQILSTEKA